MDGALVLFVPAPGQVASARHLFEAATEGVTGYASPATRWKTGTVPWRALLRADLDAARAAASCRKGVPVSPRKDRIWLSHVPVVDW
jgi:hypothetical protein